MKQVTLFFVAILATESGDAAAAHWREKLQTKIQVIDEKHSGNLGVYIKSLGDGGVVQYETNRRWYLSSTVKVPVAIQLLQRVETGEFSLDEKVVLREGDYVDGAGDLLRAAPGSRYSLRQLLEKMLMHSDSTATDILIRRIGVKELNDGMEALVPGGFGPLTTILQVRYLAYGELHPRAEMLTNRDFLALKSVKGMAARRKAFAVKVGVSPSSLLSASMDEAFERYYRRGVNAGSLTAYGELLEKLVHGDLLSPQHTTLMLDLMERMTTGERRLKAGLPAGVRFAQKTGTQHRRACNVGIIREQSDEDAVIVTACVEKTDLPNAEATLRAVGRAIVDSGVLENAPTLTMKQ